MGRFIQIFLEEVGLILLTAKYLLEVNIMYFT